MSRTIYTKTLDDIRNQLLAFFDDLSSHFEKIEGIKSKIVSSAQTIFVETGSSDRADYSAKKSYLEQIISVGASVKMGAEEVQVQQPQTQDNNASVLSGSEVKEMLNDANADVGLSCQ